MDFETFTTILQKADSVKVSVVIDWLSVLYHIEDEDFFPPSHSDEETRVLTETITVKNLGSGNEHYKHRWSIMYNGENIATLLTHTRNHKFVRAGSCKIDFQNYLLYTSNLWPYYREVVAALHLTYKNVSRLDIAIDGMNYLYEFMNAYCKQHKQTKVVEMKGRPRLNSKVLDRSIMMYQNFTIGHSSSPKMVTIYNKSLEIVRSGKHYIQEYWLRNGICNYLLPIQQLQKAIDKEAMYLDGYENMYRFELRLKGSKVLEMQQFNIEWLTNVNTLMSLVHRHCENFFQFVKYIRTDVSKCPPLNVIPYQLFDIVPIDLARIKPKEDLYKTKLSIKKNVRQLYVGNLLPEEYSVKEMLVFDIRNFDLNKWYEKRLPQWIKEFEAINHNNEQKDTIKKLLLNVLRETQTAAQEF